MVDEAYQQCEALLTEKLDIVHAIAQRLLEKEVIGEEDLVEILGPRPFSKPVDYDSFVGRFEDDRRKRTGRTDNDGDDPTAKDGSPTPPIPVEGAEDTRGGRGHPGTGPGATPKKRYPSADDPIPELC